MITAGKRGMPPCLNSFANRLPTSVTAPPALFCSQPIPKNRIQLIPKGIAAVFIISRIFSYISVRVTSDTKRVLVDTGEQRSPKKAPDMIAPPAITGLTPIVWAMAIQIAPMVAAVPKAVPIRKDTRQFNKKARRIKMDGVISCTQYTTMVGIVPADLHKPVSTPINTIVSSTFFTVLIPCRHISAVSFRENPFFRLYAENSSSPPTKAYKTGIPKATQPISIPVNTASTSNSIVNLSFVKNPLFL